VPNTYNIQLADVNIDYLLTYIIAYLYI